MVRLLIGLRATVTGHQVRRAPVVALVLAVVVGLVFAVGTLALGFLHHDRPGAAGDILAAVFALWLGGQVAQAALAGEATLRPEVFALLPLEPRRLAFSLLVVGLADPVLLLLLLAYAALVPVGVRGGAVAGVVAVLAAVLTTVMTAILSTIAAGVLGPGARRGHDAGTLLTAMALSVLALGGTLLPAAMTALDGGTARWLSVGVRALPSGWGSNAVDAARDGANVHAAAWLTALVALTLGAAAWWPRVLQRRMSATPHSTHASTTPARRRLLPATPTSAVAAKELRLWGRDPLRLTCLLIAAIVGVGVAVIPRITAHTGLLMPFAGPLTVLIAGACACNIYGNDGTSLWVTVVTPDSARPDVRGRQLAWALIVIPFTLVETVALTVVSGEPALWPWALALLLALLGGAAGLLPLASLVAVQPLDEAGNPTPGWSVKVHVALYVVAATAAPAAGLLIVAAVTGVSWWAWAAVVMAAATAGLLTFAGNRWAIRRLTTTQVDVLQRLAMAA